MKSNPQKKVAIWALIAAFIGLFLMFGPVGFGWMDGFGGGFALAAFGLLIMIAGITTAVLFFRLAKRYDLILSDKNPLARWTYSDAEWRAFTEADYKIDRKNRWILVGIISAFAIFFGILFAIMDRDAGIYVLFVMLALIVLVSITAFLTSQQNYRRNIRHKGETLIASDGLILNGQLHAWNVIGSRLERVDYMEEAPPMIEFEYSAVSRSGRDSYTVRVPIPSDQEKGARDIVQFFRDSLEQSGIVKNNNDAV
ncbi:MAG: hypothetical protein WC455_01630 [Dehalococcoidia bacterium]|jgi:uncharacterized membrane protein (UPF0182 family)